MKGRVKLSLAPLPGWLGTNRFKQHSCLNLCPASKCVANPNQIGLARLIACQGFLVVDEGRIDVGALAQEMVIRHRSDRVLRTQGCATGNRFFKTLPAVVTGTDAPIWNKLVSILDAAV